MSFISKALGIRGQNKAVEAGKSSGTAGASGTFNFSRQQHLLPLQDKTTTAANILRLMAEREIAGLTDDDKADLAIALRSLFTDARFSTSKSHIETIANKLSIDLSLPPLSSSPPPSAPPASSPPPALHENATTLFNAAVAAEANDFNEKIGQLIEYLKDHTEEINSVVTLKNLYPPQKDEEPDNIREAIIALKVMHGVHIAKINEKESKDVLKLLYHDLSLSSPKSQRLPYVLDTLQGYCSPKELTDLVLEVTQSLHKEIDDLKDASIQRGERIDELSQKWLRVQGRVAKQERAISKQENTIAALQTALGKQLSQLSEEEIDNF